MHDIKEIRENLKEFSNQIKKRNVDVKFDEILELDKENRSLIQEKELSLIHISEPTRPY